MTVESAAKLDGAGFSVIGVGQGRRPYDRGGHVAYDGSPWRGRALTG